MKTIQLTVNGKAVCATAVEPRTQLADFLRDSLDLTGTHLGCEHGVCGACTLMIDGVPARSCITLAVACDGARITTIEGMDDDVVMRALRAAFSREHALQCGYCTPGMLASAHDVVLRMPDATEQDIRYAMSGNLCRCTGYVGIVRAVQSVIAERKAAGIIAAVSARETLGPVGSGHAQPMAAGSTGSAGSAGAAAAAKAVPVAKAPDPVAAGKAPAVRPAVDSSKPMTTLNQSFNVDFPRDKVWEFFGRLADVTTCLPGASLLAPPTDTHVEPKLRIKVGPIVADFEGAADVVRDPAHFTGTIFGSARDTKSSSATRGEIRYVLNEEKDGAATRVDVQVGFALTGSLAQFSRSSIVKDIAQRMTDAFAANLRARLGHEGGDAGGGAAPPQPAAELNAGALVFSVLRDRILGFFRSVFGGR
ncbi:2Fe-2S iron-sulfur cluster-binding protein [Variovorax sp. M-6]|uniref:xanthine dehydrogenase family Fe-S subunit n=1 Tax=Variovorax sp. M-6 TaxID=3233041 RepID=UPI003F963E8E